MIKCQVCQTKIYGKKKEGDRFKCWKCKEEYIIKDGEAIKNERRGS